MKRIFAIIFEGVMVILVAVSLYLCLDFLFLDEFFKQCSVSANR